MFLEEGYAHCDYIISEGSEAPNKVFLCNLVWNTGLHHFWAIVRKMVCPILLDRCLSVLSVCLSVCLSVMFVYSGQTVGWIRMPLGMEEGLSPVDFA